MFSTTADAAAYANSVRNRLAVKSAIKTAALVVTLVVVYKYAEKKDKNTENA